MGKGDKKRESCIPDWLYDLNYDLAIGEITAKRHKELKKEKEWYDKISNNETNKD